MSAPLAAITIRRPLPTEGPACQFLLPDHSPQGGPREFLVAVQEAEPRIVGAAAFRARPGALMGVRIRVVRTHRRRGIGSMLVEYVQAEGRRRGARTVVARVETSSEPDGKPFLLRHGFEHVSRLHSFEADLQTIFDSTHTLRLRMTEAAKVPGTARLVRLEEAPVDHVARLYAEHIAHNPDLDPALLRRPSFRQQLRSSPVLLAEDRVAGFVLWWPNPRSPVAGVPAFVVAPECRGTWAAVLLVEDFARTALGMGLQRTRFEVVEGNAAMLRLARRWRAETLHVTDRYLRSIE